MKPERASEVLLGVTRARAKMHEYSVPEADYNQITNSPSQLFSLTIGLLGDVAGSIATEGESPDSVKEKRQHLLFCARYFDSYLESRLDSEKDSYLLLLAGATYYLANFHGSAAVMATRLPSPCPDLQTSGLEGLLAWLLKGNFNAKPDRVSTIYKAAVNIFQLTTAFFESGDGAAGLLAAADELRRDAYRIGSPRELLFADLARAIVISRFSNSAWARLPEYSGLNVEVWRPLLEKPTFVRELWPAQHLLGQEGVYSGTSAVVQMPTSAGKTRALDLIIRASFYSQRTGLAIVVAPFRALCEEIRQALVRAFSGEDINVEQLTDVAQEDFDLDRLLSQRQVLVMTPEKCLYLMRHNPEIAKSLGLLILDEGHQFDSGRRGVTYELLITALRESVDESTQIILISAVLSNAQLIADWLLDDGVVVSGKDLVPTARCLAFASWMDRLGRLEFVNPLDPDEREFFVPRLIEQATLRKLGRERKARTFPDKDSSSVGLYLGLKSSSAGAVAIFVGTKTTAISMLDVAVDVYARGFEIPPPLVHSDACEIDRLVFQHAANLGDSAKATSAVRLGICSHHGTTPHGIRLAVEHSMKVGLIRLIVCTSTLAQGVNLPIRYLIITSAQQGRDRIKNRDFHNLMGRAGRSGIHTEGTVKFPRTGRRSGLDVLDSARRVVQM